MRFAKKQNIKNNPTIEVKIINKGNEIINAIIIKAVPILSTDLKNEKINITMLNPIKMATNHPAKI
ncbi:unnamed protein product [marine sediment metagenome]|uniref:Uncharacterized protein n=1 Tax=marine sediment metagenome TaxID=412755 RepID=X1A3I8_9ZZZZ